MYFYTALQNFIKALSSTTQVPGDRIYFEAVSNKSVAKPYIVISEISNPGSHNRDCPDGIARHHIEVGCYALSYTQAYKIAALIKAALDGYKGVMSDFPSVECRYNDQSDDYDSTLTPTIYIVTPEFYFYYKE